jgi:hypothetical protein
VAVLSPSLRKQLETAVLAARRAAESGSRAAIESLGVFLRDKPAHLNADQAALRNGLRAKWRQLGGDEEAMSLLVAECAYEQWHRLLFARFLAENQLLLHPQYKAPVTLEECDDLVGELGEPDGWSVAARFAAEILPGIFRLADPCLRLRLAPESRNALERILDELPPDVFAADDALGWVYQFWQKDKKDEINASERKIGGADLGPVTQLFTENYMVRFLLENSLGAWWATRHPDSPLVQGFEYLRLDDEGRPTVRSFDKWPDRTADVTVMDPCCGSGHFLVEAFSMLWRMRFEEEGLSPIEAQDAVLRDNLFGLELDPRCVQIAIMAVALQAWKTDRRWRELPVPNIACSGIPAKAPADEWKALANGDQKLENALVRLHILFRDADTLGSLIDPRRVTEITDSTGLQHSFEDGEWEEIAPLLDEAARREAADPATGVLGADASGIARATNYLSREYTLIVTNPPFVSGWSTTDLLTQHLANHFDISRGNLATAMLQRTLSLLASGGVSALVTPQSWLDQKSYEKLRVYVLSRSLCCMIARLGPGAFEAISGEVVDVALCLFRLTLSETSCSTTDVAWAKTPKEKASALSSWPLQSFLQESALAGPEARILFGELPNHAPISDMAECRWGLSAGDDHQFQRSFWEVPALCGSWERLQTSSADEGMFTGRESIVLWENEQGRMARLAYSVRHLNHKAQQWRSGKPIWGRQGVALNTMGRCRPTLYLGDRFSQNCMVIAPFDQSNVPALWLFAASGELEASARILSRSLGLSPGTVLNVPFDVDRWRRVADEQFPGGLPEPRSNDPTQWLFNGRPETSTAPLQVAVGRLVGYRWPEQAEPDGLDSLADQDGVVPLPSVAGEAPAADRIQRLLAAAFGTTSWPTKANELLEQGGSRKKSLADWLRDEFFKQHCALFGNRPFVWHIWDGQRDGFSALVNYHRLDRKTLEKLTYTYLGQDWVERQRSEVRDEVPGAEGRLSAALELQRKLEAILEGEKPFDIYVRWKELHEQPIGWEPDLNDGVRLNIRPFVEAGVLRAPFNIHWKKDRGRNPDGSERLNDIHLSLAEKRGARRKAGV